MGAHWNPDAARGRIAVEAFRTVATLYRALHGLGSLPPSLTPGVPPDEGRDPRPPLRLVQDDERED